MKTIFLVFLIFLVGCTSPKPKQNTCLTLSTDFYKYKYEALVDCNNSCIQNKVSIFSKRLNKFLNPYLLTAKALDEKRVSTNKVQFASIRNSSSSEFCGSLNNELKKIFLKSSNQKLNGLVNLIRKNSSHYYKILLASKKIITNKKKILINSSNESTQKKRVKNTRLLAKLNFQHSFLYQN